MNRKHHDHKSEKQDNCSDANGLARFQKCCLQGSVHVLTFFSIDIETGQKVNRIVNRKKGQDVDTALRTTLLETGKPVCITTIILFFGFMVMMFSIHPPSVIVGKLIAVTLITALMSDLFINPVLLRWWIKDKKI